MKRVNNVTIILLLLLFSYGEQYHCRRMRTVRLIIMDYTSLKPLIVHVRCLIQVISDLPDVCYYFSLQCVVLLSLYLLL